jgi:hypothetical protein
MEIGIGRSIGSSSLRAETPGLEAGKEVRPSLQFDVLGDNRKRRSAARRGKVGRRPENAISIASADFGAHLAHYLLSAATS